jgi:hypothetical protein
MKCDRIEPVTSGLSVRVVTRHHSTPADTNPRSSAVAAVQLIRGGFDSSALARHSHAFSQLTTDQHQKTCKKVISVNGAYGIRTHGLRLAKPIDSPTPPDDDQQKPHG